ncbi:GerMN domain-containing protein [Spongisporangium articulatum]|uniref:GerMN domain-containing protein n=1 Tax=Spongisporangium articulatum TaxID=3362603 RepID=A0ABW8AM22_9ACTN
MSLTTGRRVVARRLAPVAVVVAVAACGVPTGGTSTVAATARVPYGLLNTAAPDAGAVTSLAPAAARRTRIALVAGDGRIRMVPRARPVDASVSTVQSLLDQLAAGPSDEERRTGLGSALPTGVRLQAGGPRSGILTVDLSEGTPVQAADRLAVAVGQIVLTVTAVPGVRAVRLQRRGQPVDAPLPSGALTTRELVAADYQTLLDDPPSGG